MNFFDKFGSASTIWYPASGFHSSSGGILDVGYCGYYWSASPYSNDIYPAFYLFFSCSGSVDPSYDGYRASGFAVRCARE